MIKKVPQVRLEECQIELESSMCVPLTTSCWLSHRFEYMQESAVEERKEPLPNNVCESAFQRTNRAILSSANFCTIYLGRHFSLSGNAVVEEIDEAIKSNKINWIISTCYLIRCYHKH